MAVNGASNSPVRTQITPPPTSTPPAAQSKAAAPTAAAPKSTGGTSTHSQDTFVVAGNPGQTRGAQQTQAKTPAQQVSDVSDAINNISGYAGAALSVVQGRLDKGMVSTKQGVEAALDLRAQIGAGAAVAVKGYDKTLKQINNLLKNPVVQKDANLVKRLQGEAARVQGLRADTISKFKSKLAPVDRFLGKNTALLNNLGQKAKALQALGTALNVTGALTNGISQGVNSPAQTAAGKFADGFVAGVVNLVVAGRAPGLSTADSLTGQNVNKTLNGVVATGVTAVEAAITGDTAGLASLEQKMREGQYGPLFQTANVAGNALASLSSPQAREQYVEAARRGDYGPVGKFGDWLGTSIGRALFGGD